MDEDSNLELVQRFYLRDDASAFELLYIKYWPRLTASAVAQLFVPHQACDWQCCENLAQEVFKRLLEHLATKTALPFYTNEHVEAWLFETLRRCVCEVRDRPAHRRWPALPDSIKEEVVPNKDAHLHEQDEILDWLQTQCTPAEWGLLLRLARKSNASTYQTIAQESGREYGTLRNEVCELRKRLRQRLVSIGIECP